MSDVARRFYVDADRRVTGSALRAHAVPDDSGALFEVGRIDPDTQQVTELYVDVSATGYLCAFKGIKLVGGGLDLYVEGQPRYRIEANEEGLSLSSLQGEGGRLLLNEDGVHVTGNLFVTGHVHSAA